MEQIVKSNTVFALCEKKNGKEALAGDIVALIIEVKNYRGISTLTTKDAITMAATYVEDLRTDFPQLELAEIRKIFEYGRKGKLGEYFGLNAGTLYDWTSAYVKSDAHKEYRIRRMETAARAMLPERAALTEDDRKRLINDKYRRFLNMKLAKNVEKRIGSIGGIMAAVTGGGKYSYDHPLWDGGNALTDWLHRQGFVGNMEAIFSAAEDKGWTKIFDV